MSWSTPFPDPIALPDGGKLATLQDAGEYITRLPKQTHDARPWQNAMHVLIQAAEYEGPIEFARLGMLQALFPKGTPVYHSVDKDTQWRNRTKLARDR
ncbi:hypothetical protein SAMN05216374_0953 [Tardiphaga sp. OK246]|uniref:hypothetical protein n=1 Tax=Tardiphaga sp. OK246 TaxID=1855307 RepID=UPI000B63BE26|nr:hypothetical protein [Tardiphaga sp. OK246]SNS35563.1 hypothetical protein SAMN05216374_0953 [Tardiphaga sp. OK246]